MATLDYDKIAEGIRKALYGYEVRESLAQSIEWTKTFVTQSVTRIETSDQNTKTSETNAKTSETNAKSSERKAKASETAAASSASAAKTSETNAGTSETNAKTSETNAKTSETNAKASETKAATSETNAKASETNAKTSETNAKSSETKAATSEANAKTSETNAKASADSMGTSVATCTTKAKEAEASAGKAAASETNAGTSETNAKASENETRRLVEGAKKIVSTDKNLSTEGAPADAAAVGKAFAGIIKAYDITLATASWVATSDDAAKNAGWTYQCDATVSGCTAALEPNATVSIESVVVAQKAGLGSICETGAGYCRFYAEKVPSAAISLRLLLTNKSPV